MRNLFLTLVLCGVSLCGTAQEKHKKDWGCFVGNVEALGGVFVKDEINGMRNLQDKRGINTWVNLGYSFKDFNAGLQYELYEPPMPGYHLNLKGNQLIQGFLSYTGEKIAIRLGNSYDQFGSGLLFRSFEDRNLGYNNSILGVNIQANPLSWVSLKGVFGKPRRYLKYSDSYVYGADAELLLSDLISPESTFQYSIGGGWLLRDDKTSEIFENAPRKTNAWACRLNYGSSLCLVKLEYVKRENSLLFSSSEGRFTVEDGEALQANVELDPSWGSFSGVFRYVKNMDFRENNGINQEEVLLNFVPALTKQHKYSLPSMYPYIANTQGEVGGQLDFYKTFTSSRSDEELFRMNINLSYYNQLASLDKKHNYFDFSGETLFREANVELEREWSKRFSSIFLYDLQVSRHNIEDVYSHIIVGDFTYKLPSNNSLRMELQHMTTSMDGDKAWIAGLLEWEKAPSWSVFVQDMYNYQTDNDHTHYYTAGGAWTKGDFRLSASWGRNKAGYSCVGGICRYVPQYTGLTVYLNMKF